MGMKVNLDYSQSARQNAPAGQAQLKFNKKEQKTTSKPPPRPMLELRWNVAHMDGIPADQYDRALIFDNIMLTADSLWKLRQLMAACNQPCICANCGESYSADPNVGDTNGACPKCGSFGFDVDLDFIDSANPLAQLEMGQDQNGRPQTRIKAYIVPGA